MRFLLTGEKGGTKRQIIATAEQTVDAIEMFLRAAISMDETSYYLQAAGTVNKASKGTAQAMQHNGAKLTVQRHAEH